MGACPLQVLIHNSWGVLGHRASPQREPGVALPLAMANAKATPGMQPQCSCHPAQALLLDSAAQLQLASLLLSPSRSRNSPQAAQVATNTGRRWPLPHRESVSTRLKEAKSIGGHAC